MHASLRMLLIARKPTIKNHAWVEEYDHAHLWKRTKISVHCTLTSPRTNRYRALSGLCGSADSAVHGGKAKANRAAGGAEASHHSPRCYPWPGPRCASQDSGVEWLGKVPEHWERNAVWQLFRIGRGKVTSHEYVVNHLGPYPLYSSQTANDGIMGHIDSFMFEGDYLTWTTDGAHAGTVFRRSGKI